ncbi:MAG: IPT/TIG domain-containing protein [Sphingomicrobium sp.]
MPPTITTETGTIAVPMSTILDALEGVLTDAEREALMGELIGLRPHGVAPGDLITAELFNRIRNDLNDVLVRLANLEGLSGGPVIERIEPQTLDKPVNSKVTIIGRNFRPDDAATDVAFGDIRVNDFFPESDATHIMVPVPVGFATLPADIPVSVISNGKQSNAVAIRVVPEVVVPTGTVLVSQQAQSAGNVQVGLPFQITWRVHSQLNVPQSFELSAVVTAPAGVNVATWRAAIQLSQTELNLGIGEFKDVVMTITPPAGATSVSVSLKAESTTGTFNAQAPMAALVVGAAPAESDTRAVISFAAAAGSADLVLGNIAVDGGTEQGFKMRPSKTGELSMKVSTKPNGGGFYLFEATVEPGTPAGGGPAQAGRWTIGAMPTTKLKIEPSSTIPFQVPISSSALVDTATVSRILIKAKCFSSAGASSPDFTSFLRVPIIGKS